MATKEQMEAVMDGYVFSQTERGQKIMERCKLTYRREYADAPELVTLSATLAVPADTVLPPDEHGEEAIWCFIRFCKAALQSAEVGKVVADEMAKAGEV